MSGARRRAPAEGHQRVRVVPDDDGRGGLTVLVDGVPSSHLDPDEPTRLDFEYMRWAGDALDVLAPHGRPLAVTHLGGAGCTLARYVEATRPGSRQVVLEVDPEVVEVVRRELGLRSSRRLRMRVADGRAGLAGAGPDQDVVLRDAFDHGTVPAHLTTTAFLAQVRARLTAGGVYLANLADDPRMGTARREAATALACFRQVAMMAEPGQLRGRRYGNVLLMAGDRDLPLSALGRRLASGAVRARLLDTDQVRAFASGYPPLLDPDPPLLGPDPALLDPDLPPATAPPAR